MSLLRTVYLGAVICGWMAFGGWFAAEILRQGVVQGSNLAAPNSSADDAPRFLGSRTLGQALATEKDQTIAAFCLVGAAIGAGLGLAGGLSNWQRWPQVFRMLRGLFAGGLGGISGGWVGALIYQTFAPSGGASGVSIHWWLRPIGWMAAGALVGLADGLFALSPNRIRNGLIGGLCGGLIGGILFDPIKAIVARTAGAADPTFQFEITSRAAGFVAVGLCIGAAVGLTHFLLRHAWLTVLDGDRPGRQVILTGRGLTLGSDPGAGLPFLREADRSLLPEHARVVRGHDGSFSLIAVSPGADAEVSVIKHDNRVTRSLKNESAKGIILSNDSVITCGRNSIRFSEKVKRGNVARPKIATAAQARPEPKPAQAPPPPKPPSPKAAHQPAQPAQPPPVSPPRQTVPEQPISPPAAPRPAPAPVPPSRPAPAPTTSPKPAPPVSPQPQPQPAARAENVCPNGHNVPAGQRYCIVCDTYF
jgi:hypothetical protein